MEALRIAAPTVPACARRLVPPPSEVLPATSQCAAQPTDTVHTGIMARLTTVGIRLGLSQPELPSAQRQAQRLLPRVRLIRILIIRRRITRRTILKVR